MLSRRKRLVVRTLWISAALIAVVVWVVVGDNTQPYRPGESLDGITDTLKRGLPDDYRSVVWRDATDEVGIDFRHFPGTRSIQLPEDMGSGAAWGDFDNDGWIDLYIVNVAGPLPTYQSNSQSGRNALYRNIEGKRFEDVTLAAGVGRQALGHGAVWADYSGDGLLDLVVTEYGSLALYRNLGGGRFELVGDAGLETFQGFWTGVSWADYDRDGDLDLYVCGYVRYTPLEPDLTEPQYQTLSPASINPSSFPSERNLLLQNNDGMFTDVADFAGVSNAAGKSLSAIWWDFNNDGWLDLYVANDVSDNVLFRNLQDGRFDDVSLATFVADYRGAMGLAVGDVDTDGDLDLFVTHWIAQENAYYQNLFSDLNDLGVPASESMRFSDNAEQMGLGQVALDYVGWGTAFLDFDLDTRLDLIISNGHTLSAPDLPEKMSPMQPQIFWNAGIERGFFDVSPVSGEALGRWMVGRGLAVGDYDNDGDPDALFVAHGEPCLLLRNDQDTGNSWLKVRLHGRGQNCHGVGARVTLVAGTKRQIRESTAGSSYCSQHAAGEILFGLGGSASVDSLVIRWPLGDRQVLTDIGINQTVVAEEPLP